MFAREYCLLKAVNVSYGRVYHVKDKPGSVVASGVRTMVVQLCGAEIRQGRAARVADNRYNYLDSFDTAHRVPRHSTSCRRLLELIAKYKNQ